MADEAEQAMRREAAAEQEKKNSKVDTSEQDGGSGACGE